MKKEIFNILFLSVVVLAVGWLYWTQDEASKNSLKVNSENFILALSWQPAFCEGRPNKPECRSQRKNSFDANHFSLHGLWPQPRNNIYCDVPKNIIELDKRGRWTELPKLEIAGKWRNELSRRMPGYRSKLHRHEWYKHGTCMGDEVDPEQYFGVSMAMIDEINSSAIRTLFSENIGKQITATQIVTAMETSFGQEAGKRITISCKRDKRRTLINEIRISITHKVNGSQFGIMSEKISSAPKLPIGCKRGIVDPVGLQ